MVILEKFPSAKTVCGGLTLRYRSSAPFSMYSVTIMACLTAHTQTHKRTNYIVELTQNRLENWEKSFKKKGRKLTEVLTFGHHPLQTNDVLVGELTHDGGLAQKVLPLFLRVAWLQCLDSHRNLFPPRHLQNTTVHLTKLSCRTQYQWVESMFFQTVYLQRRYLINVCLIHLLGFLAARVMLCNRAKTRKSLRLFCLRLSHRGVFWLGVERQLMLFNWWMACGVGAWESAVTWGEKGGLYGGNWGVGVCWRRDYWFKGQRWLHLNKRIMYDRFGQDQRRCSDMLPKILFLQHFLLCNCSC